MLWGSRWRQVALWAERLPLWFQILVLPILGPAGCLVAGACLCPRTAATSATLLTAVYAAALATNLIDWPTIGREVGILYLGFVIHLYFGMVLEYLPKELYPRWRGTREAPRIAEESREPVVGR